MKKQACLRCGAYKGERANCSTWGTNYGKCLFNKKKKFKLIKQ